MVDVQELLLKCPFCGKNNKTSVSFQNNEASKQIEIQCPACMKGKHKITIPRKITNQANEKRFPLYTKAKNAEDEDFATINGAKIKLSGARISTNSTGD